jgi:peptidyl-prolyl cis-trans isomerase SurA
MKYFRSAKRSAFFLLVALVCGNNPSRGAQETILDGVAAVVQAPGATKPDVVTYSQVRELVGAREKALRDGGVQGNELVEKIKEIRTAALNELVDRQLILQEFEKNKFNIPEYVIDDHVQTLIREEFNNDRSAFMRTLQAQGFTYDRFRQIEKEKIIVQAMRQKSVKVETVIPPRKIEEYYEQHHEEFGTPEQIKLRMIVTKKEENESGIKAKMMGELRQKIAAGADFGSLAEMYSEDSTKDSKGDWGWIDKKTLNEELTRVAFGMKPGQVSKVIEMAGNYYLLYVEAKKNATVKPFGEVRDDIEKKLLQVERQKLQQRWIESLRKKAYIKTF